MANYFPPGWITGKDHIGIEIRTSTLPRNMHKNSQANIRRPRLWRPVASGQTPRAPRSHPRRWIRSCWDPQSRLPPYTYAARTSSRWPWWPGRAPPCLFGHPCQSRTCSTTAWSPPSSSPCTHRSGISGSWSPWEEVWVPKSGCFR